MSVNTGKSTEELIVTKPKVRRSRAPNAVASPRSKKSKVVRDDQDLASKKPDTKRASKPRASKPYASDAAAPILNAIEGTSASIRRESAANQIASIVDGEATDLIGILPEINVIMLPDADPSDFPSDHRDPFASHEVASNEIAEAAKSETGDDMMPVHGAMHSAIGLNAEITPPSTQKPVEGASVPEVSLNVAQADIDHSDEDDGVLLLDARFAIPPEDDVKVETAPSIGRSEESDLKADGGVSAMLNALKSFYMKGGSGASIISEASFADAVALDTATSIRPSGGSVGTTHEKIALGILEISSAAKSGRRLNALEQLGMHLLLSGLPYSEF